MRILATDIDRRFSNGFTAISAEGADFAPSTMIFASNQAGVSGIFSDVASNGMDQIIKSDHRYVSGKKHTRAFPLS